MYEALSVCVCVCVHNNNRNNAATRRSNSVASISGLRKIKLD